MVALLGVGLALLPGAGDAAFLGLLLVPFIVAVSLRGSTSTRILSGAVAALVSAVLIRMGDPGFPLHGGLAWAIQASAFVGLPLVGVWLVGRSDARDVDDDTGVDPEGVTLTGVDAHRHVLSSLANVVEVRDRATQGHCQHVAWSALVVGRALGLDEREQHILYWAARLHDLGKIAVPESILLKAGALSDDETAEIRRHAAYGADLIVSVSPALRPIADVVRAHHERWDGHGYPLGYREEEIPRLARVLAIADVFEALTSVRPYREPASAAQAAQYIYKEAGSQFDPELVAVFRGLVDRGELGRAFGPPTERAMEGSVPQPTVLEGTYL